MLTLETDRLLLRDFRPADFEPFFGTTQSAAYRRFYPEDEMIRGHWRSIFDRILASQDVEERTMFQLAACLKTDELIGTCGVRIEDGKNQIASFGCAIAEPYWGWGYAFETSRRLIAYSFHELPVRRIYAETISENRRARALVERLDMRLEGVLRENRFFRGRWWSTAIYAVLDEEWKWKHREEPKGMP
jgi:RimJ/RimL family protein N-acetyltransferase